MSSYNKQKGTKFETDVMKYLRELGHFAERLAKAGSNDEGDIVTIIAGQTYILECKNRKAMNLPQFWDEAQTEAANYAKARGQVVAPPAFVIVKRRKASIEDAWVIQSLEQWLDGNSNQTNKEIQKNILEKEISNTIPEMGEGSNNKDANTTRRYNNKRNTKSRTTTTGGSNRNRTKRGGKRK